MSDGPEPFVCAVYTHGRRFPQVLGKIGGWALPVQLSVAQVAVLVMSFAGLVWAWPWCAYGPATVNLVVVLGVPTGLTWAARRVRVEGRSAIRAAAGYVTYLARPRAGVRLGRPIRPARPVRLVVRVWLAAGEAGRR